MKKEKVFQLYTGMWLIAILVLFVLLWTNSGDARIINYSGIVRGATQKLVKEEMSGQQDDTLIARLDGIISNLQTGKGEYNLDRSSDRDFQEQLSQLKLKWEDVKTEIYRMRSGENSGTRLFELSQQHFELADDLVLYAEDSADRKLTQFMLFYGVSLVLSVMVFGAMYRRNQREQEILITVDKLTGLLNRNGFEKAATERLHRSAKQKFMIVEFDIDNFKSINNLCGYAAGDALLQILAETVKKRQDKAICARIDADNFVVLMEQTENVASLLEDALSQTAKNQGMQLSVGDIRFTYGAYRIENNSELIKTIMDKANTAHKMAKLQGDHSFLWYDEQLLQKLRQESHYREQMHHGIAAGEFLLYLQPKVDLTHMEVFGAEALVRWDLPGSGMVYPDSFIPLFEKDGSIVDLDFYMLEKTCQYLKEWLAGGGRPLTISVNFSRVTLYQKQFYERFVEIVDRYQIPHSCIEMEVTESAFNEITDTVLRVLTSLKNTGFYVSMDDFGSGYSNLNVLSKLPIQIIKLDREFLWEMEHSESVKGIVTCIVNLAHTMGIRVVCEGVEQKENVAFLQEIGCDYAQGYYFAKPIAQDDFTRRYPELENALPRMDMRTVQSQRKAESAGWNAEENLMFGEILAQTYPGFLSLRNEKQEIVYLNENFKKWIARYTDVNPLGKTNVELSAIVPENVADTFMQCHDGSLELQANRSGITGLKKVLEFKGAAGGDEPSQYFDVLKYWITIRGVSYIFTIAYDVTELYVENMQNLYSSMTDNLTGAKNRRYLQSNMNLYYGHYAVVFDLDHFKWINDQEGHNVGDKILKEFVAFIREYVPGLTSVIRLGGDEFFAAFQNGMDLEDIQESLHRARVKYEQCYSAYEYLSFSIGVDLVGYDLEETLERLDKQMYQDKQRWEAADRKDCIL